MNMVPIGEIVDFIGGGTPSRDVNDYWNGDIPWASVKDFKGPLIDSTLESITQDGLLNSSSTLIPAGHVIMPTRMALGKAAINSIDVAINQDLKALKPKRQVHTRYLLHAVLSRAKEIQSHGKGATVQGITIERLSPIQIPLPPLEEQRRIAAILDKANRITSLQQDARSVVGNLPRSLFLSLFGDPRVNPHSWPECTLGELGRVVTGSTPPSSLDGMFNGAIPFVTPGDLGSGFEPRRSLTEAGALRSRIVRRGSALACCIGATIGKMDIVQQDSAFNQQINAVEWGDAVIDEYGIESLRFLKDAIATAGASTTLPILKKSSFEKLRIPVPPIDLQRDFSQRLKAIDPYLAKLQNAAQHGASLRQTVTARAFSGELLA